MIQKNTILYLGSFLRKYSIDEFPQLFNIIKGDMKFIGPRPSLSKSKRFKSFKNGVWNYK